jgi:Zn-dependent protease with chaperone function
MNQEQFERRVAIFESAALRNPRAYKFRVFLLALLGYGYLGTVLLLLLALLVGAVLSVVALKFVALKVVIVLAGFIGLLLRAMWVEISAPHGLPIKVDEAPALFARIEELRKELRAPRFHRVLVTDEFNAGVVQVPRLGMFGWQKNYLLLGLPLLKCLTPAQLDAVLAHELGHLAGGHARFSNWLYRMRMIWTQLHEELSRRRSRGSFLFQGFFNWYVPYFNACTFPLARANEYEADRASARLTSSATAAEALTGVRVIGQYLGQRFWPSVFSRANDEPHPNVMPYTVLALDLPSQIEGDDVKQWLGVAVTERGSAGDTHPSLDKRLQAIGESPRFAPPPPGGAAESLLGAARTRVENYLNSRWQNQVTLDWRKRFDEVREGRSKLALLAAKNKETELDNEEALDRATLEEEFGAGADAALEQLLALHERDPENPRACFALGQRLLQRADAAGIALMEKSMQLHDEAKVLGLRVLRDYYWRMGDSARANELHARLVDEVDLRESAQRERQHILTTEVFDEPDLDAATVESLRVQLAAVAELKMAYLARKRVHHLPEHHCYLLGFTTKTWWQRHNAARARDVQRRILAQVTFPAHTVVFNIEARNRRFAAKFRRLPGAKLI